MDLRVTQIDGRFDLLDERIEGVRNDLTAAFRGELIAAITSQTRILVFSLLGGVFGAGGLVLAATRLG